MKKFLLKIVILVFLYSFSLQVNSQEMPNSISLNDKLYSLSTLWSEVKYNFVNIDTIKCNIDSLYRVLIPEVVNSKNDYSYYQILERFIARLNDGHSEVYDNGQFRRYCDYPPVKLTNIDKRIFVTLVAKNFEEKLPLGSEIREIENLSIEKYLEKYCFPYVSASNEGSRWNIAVSKIHYYLKDQPLKLKYIKPNGGMDSITLLRDAGQNSDKYSLVGILPPQKKIIDLRWTSDSLAILQYNSFSPEQKAIDEFECIVPEVSKSKGLIIDIRNNGGGSTITAINLLRHIVKDSYFLMYGWETRINDAVRKSSGIGNSEYKEYNEFRAYRKESPDTIIISETYIKFKMPMVILIGNNTYSAAEDFLVMLYETKNRPALIGSSTGGSTGSPLVISDLPNGGSARICTRRIIFPVSGKKFIYMGIEPDIRVNPTINDVLKNHDVVLDSALNIIREKLKYR